MRGQRADPDAVADGRDAGELGHARDVDQRGGLGQAEGEGGEERLATGQELRVGAGRAPEREDVGKRARPDIGERRRFHRWLLPGRTPRPRFSGSLWAGAASFKGVVIA